MADESKPRRVPLGDPMTEEELARLADVSESDLEDAKARFRDDAPAGFKDLLDAEREGESE